MLRPASMRRCSPALQNALAPGALALVAGLVLGGGLSGCKDEKDAPTGERAGSGAKVAGDRDGGPAAGRDGGLGSGGRGGSAAGGSDAGEPDAGDAGGAGGSGGRGGAGGSGGTGGSGGSGGTGPACVPTGEQMFASLGAEHTSTPQDPSTYNSRPPSSGTHCDAWGRWAEFTPAFPLPACNFLHNLEHGSVVLLYNCPDGCNDVVELLRQVVADAPLDPNCSGQGIKRLLITPYADMEAKVAAVAWSYTWTSDCTDADTHDDLIEFITRHWGTNPADRAPEPTICGHGSIAP